MTTLNSTLTLSSQKAVAVREITLPFVFKKKYSILGAEENVLLQRNIIAHMT